MHPRHHHRRTAASSPMKPRALSKRARDTTMPSACGSKRPEELDAARREIALLPEVAAVESDVRDLRLTAVPKPGANALSAVSALIAKYDWEVPELHLESGRLDEVFRSVDSSRDQVRADAPPTASKERRLEQGYWWSSAVNCAAISRRPWPTSSS